MSVNVNLELRNAVENASGIAQYKPGDLVEGTVQIIVEKNIKFRTATIALLWRTEGRGDLNTDTVDGKTLCWTNLHSTGAGDSRLRGEAQTQSGRFRS